MMMPAKHEAPRHRAVSVHDFGALGDGVANDAHAIQAALDAGARQVTIPDGVYRLDRPIRPHAGQSVELLGTLRNGDGVIQALTRDVSPGDDRIAVEDGSAFAVGQWVTLHDTQLPIQGGGRKTRRECAGNARIMAIDGNLLTLDTRSARSYRLDHKGCIGTQHSAVLITASGVHVHGDGTIDGNRLNQLNCAAGPLDAERGEDWRANCGIAIHGREDGLIRDVVIKGITVRDTVLHGISMRNAERCVIRHTACIGAHDKNLTLRNCRDCMIEGNTAADSVFEDGIIFHQVADPALACRRISLLGNLCTGNARNGISIGANMRAIILAGNVCANNGINLQLSGDQITSTGDMAAGCNTRLFPADAPRPNVHLRGRHIRVSNLSALDSPFVNLEISGQDVRVDGGLVGRSDPVSIDAARGVGIALTAASRNRQPVLPTDVTLSGVTVSGCECALRIATEVRRLTLCDNRFAANTTAVECPPEAWRNIRLRDNTGIPDRH